MQTQCVVLKEQKEERGARNKWKWVRWEQQKLNS
jgi:hypothetical protein